MHRSVKATLLSALVFPGAGQWFLKRGARACLFVLPTIAAIAVFVNEALEQATLIANQILAGTAPVDPVTLAARLEQGSGDSALGTAAAIVLVVCWIGSIIDAYLLARTSATPHA
ncbi:MAG: hypothetical protein H7335_09175 [Massilia sp.]|nr:hypothetical protein [Massilia sp.]